MPAKPTKRIQLSFAGTILSARAACNAQHPPSVAIIFMRESEAHKFAPCLCLQVIYSEFMDFGLPHKNLVECFRIMVRYKRQRKLEKFDEIFMQESEAHKLAINYL